MLCVTHGYYDLYYPQESWVEQNPSEIIGAVQSAVSELADRCGGLQDIQAISLSSQISAQCLVDAFGEPLTPILSWLDKRATLEAEEINAKFSSEELFRETGVDMVVTPAYSLAKLMWLRRHQPELLDRAKYFVQIKELLIHMLTGEWVSDPTSLKGLIHQETLQPAERILVYIGTDTKVIPPVKQPDDVAGYLRSGIEGFERLTPGIPVITGWNDMNAAFLGMSGLPEFCTGLDMTGTSEHLGIIVRKQGDRIHKADYPGLNRVGFLKQWETFYGVTNTAGRAVEWFGKRVAMAESAGQWFGTLEDNGRWNQLLFIPYIAGERNPFELSSGNGMFLNLSPDHGLREMGLALIEGVTFALKLIYERLPIKPESLIVSGGAARNALWNQMKADAFGIPVRKTENEQAGCLGAAILAMRYLCGNDYKVNPRDEQVYYPEAASVEVKQEKYMRFLKVLEDLNPLTKKV